MCLGYGGGYNEREGVEYIKRDESDDEFDEVRGNQYVTCLFSALKKSRCSQQDRWFAFWCFLCIVSSESDSDMLKCISPAILSLANVIYWRLLAFYFVQALIAKHFLHSMSTLWAQLLLLVNSIVWGRCFIYNCGVWSQVSYDHRRSRVQTPLKSWLFQASLHNCLNCVYNCNVHSLLDDVELLKIQLLKGKKIMFIRFTELWSLCIHKEVWAKL